MFRSLFLFFLVPIFSFAEIIEIDHLEKFEERVQSVDSSVLVLFDVDDTLIAPKDVILKKCNKKILHKLIKDTAFIHHLDKKHIEHFMSIVFAQMQFEHVNIKSVEVLNSLQKRGVPTLAFTAAKTGKFGVVEDLSKWRFDQLQALGFDFRKTFGSAVMKFTEERGAPLLFGGILFASEYPKGEILVKFLDRINYRFSRILLLDDNQEFLKSVEEALKIKGIPFEGYLYHEEILKTFLVDFSLAKKQMEVLIKEKRWISDAEAK